MNISAGLPFDLAVSFCDQAALAIENARLREKIQEEAVAAERNRIAQEALNNLAKHSGANKAEIELKSISATQGERAEKGSQRIAACLPGDSG